MKQPPVFMIEYAGHIKLQIKNNGSIPSGCKGTAFKRIDKLIIAYKNGLMSVADVMSDLSDIELIAGTY